MDVLDLYNKKPSKENYKNISGDTWAGLAGMLVTGAGGYLASQNQLKGAQAAADAKKTEAMANVEVAKYNAQIAALNAQTAAGLSGTSTGAKTGMSTGAIIALVVLGVGVIGTGIYLAVRK